MKLENDKPSNNVLDLVRPKPKLVIVERRQPSIASKAGHKNGGGDHGKLPEHDIQIIITVYKDAAAEFSGLGISARKDLSCELSKKRQAKLVAEVIGRAFHEICAHPLVYANGLMTAEIVRLEPHAEFYPIDKINLPKILHVNSKPLQAVREKLTANLCEALRNVSHGRVAFPEV